MMGHPGHPREGVEVTVYLVQSGKSGRVLIRMQAESPAHVPTMITGDSEMVSYAEAHADLGSTVCQIAMGSGTDNYLAREDGQEEPRCPGFDQLLAELDARKNKYRAQGRR
jgi:hypothetical protein